MLQDFVLNYIYVPSSCNLANFQFIPINSHEKFPVLKIPRIVQP